MSFDVLTNRYNNRRDGVNDREFELTPENVAVRSFGKLFTRTVDGDLYAQPLIVSDIWIGQTWCNAVYLATSRNWVYAYDADHPAAHVPLWTRHLGPPVPRDVIEPGYLNFGSEIGITGTPVIERTEAGGTLFVAAKTYRAGLGDRGCSYRLHALDILTGEDRLPSTLIEAQVSGRPQIRFSAKGNLNRPGLLLNRGVLYIAFGSHDDGGIYYGWILAYDPATLRQIAAYNTAPDWGEGGIWQSGTGLAGDDDGFVYAVVGNGTSPKRNERERPHLPRPAVVHAPEYGNALLKLNLNGRALTAADWYTASDVFDLNQNDEDLIGGPVLFDRVGAKKSTQRYLLGGGKDGKFYVADRDDMGHWVLHGTGNILQADPLCNYHIHGAPVVWKTADRDISAFVWSEQDCIKAFSFNGRKFGPKPKSQSTYELPKDEMRMPGGILTLSWDGQNPKTAILWAAHSTRENAMNKTVAGTVRAYDARDLGTELWTSDMDASDADRLGNLAKFSPPIVANGKVYVGTFSRELAVYGLLSGAFPGRSRDEVGLFEIRNIGDPVIRSANFGAGRYSLRLSGKGFGVDAGGAPVPEEGFLFLDRSRNTADGPLVVEACLGGVNAPDYPEARAGVLVRRDVQTAPGHPQESVGYAAIVVTQEREALFLVRDQVPIAANPPTLKPVRTIGSTGPNLKFPSRLRLTVTALNDKPGWINVVAEVARTRTEPFAVIGPAAGTEVQFDTAAADMDVNVGLFATAQRLEEVREDATPAYAHFRDVRA